VIAGIAIGAIVGAVAAAVFLMLVLSRRRRSLQNERNVKNGNCIPTFKAELDSTQWREELPATWSGKASPVEMDAGAAVSPKSRL
jgi:hypothetical protein